jgi:hypothetical protein
MIKPVPMLTLNQFIVPVITSCGPCAIRMTSAHSSAGLQVEKDEDLRNATKAATTDQNHWSRYGTAKNALHGGSLLLGLEDTVLRMQKRCLGVR